MRADIGYGRMVAAELAARGYPTTWVATAIGVPGRTLRAQLAGEYPVHPNVAQRLCKFLDADGPYVFDEVRPVLVILGKAPDPQGPRTPLTPVRLRFDTVTVTLEPTDARRAEVRGVLQRLFPVHHTGTNVQGYRTPGMAVAGPRLPSGEERPRACAWWDPWARGVAWLRFQFSPWYPPHCRLLRRLLRLASARTWSGLLGIPGVTKLARYDLAVDYQAQPAWLILQRPRAELFRMLESNRGSLTWYAGATEDAVTVYDYAEKHGVVGPLTRVEARVEPSPQPELHLIRGVESDAPRPRPVGPEFLPEPFRNVRLGTLHAPELDWAESAFLAQARIHGSPWTLGHLTKTNPADAARLQAALEKARAGPTLRQPSEALVGFWALAVDALRDRLLYRVDDDGDGSHWSDPPVPCDDDMDP